MSPLTFKRLLMFLALMTFFVCCYNHNLVGASIACFVIGLFSTLPLRFFH